MQLSGRSKGSNVVHQLQQLNGIVKQPLLRHRNGESELTNSKSTDGESAVESGHTSSAVNEQSQTPPELHNSSHKVDSDDTKNGLDHLDSKMEISENGTSETNEHNENFDSKLATEQCRGETERSNGLDGMELSVNDERVKGEEGRERVCEGEGGGGELLANEEHMEVSEEEECGSEEGYPQDSGYKPGFGKHQGGSVMYTD